MQSAAAVSRYALEYCSGSWHEFFEMVRLLDPVGAVFWVGGVIGLAVCFNGVEQKCGIQNLQAVAGIRFVMAGL